MMPVKLDKKDITRHYYALCLIKINIFVHTGDLGWCCQPSIVTWLIHGISKVRLKKGCNIGSNQVSRLLLKMISLYVY